MKTLLAIFAAMSTAAASALAADTAPSGKTESAILGGGCFWCVEAQYKMLKGVKKVVSGYAGGHVENPTYEQVCGKKTGHAEVVQVDYDPAIVSYRDIIDLFWVAHDPTTLNRQGADEGPQYRSTIMYTNEEQKKIAEASRTEAQALYDGAIVTEIVPLKKFYPAEDYHQDYFANNPNAGYCRAVVSPKVSKFRQKLKEKGKFVEHP
ncbi:MAG TPA: peptide-methionine (S)-S-oxide reductase MsrA [Prosthecobacter sp.]|nr:peptide-methionine (S)-S-oxide reductase MsrA [Prosthecobacter sp.]